MNLFIEWILVWCQRERHKANAYNEDLTSVRAPTLFGNKKLIYCKFVIHGAVNGYSRLVTF